MRINLATRSGASKTNTYDRQIPNWHMQYKVSSMGLLLRFPVLIIFDLSIDSVYA
jgi:hypothetical protein